MCLDPLGWLLVSLVSLTGLIGKLLDLWLLQFPIWVGSIIALLHLIWVSQVLQGLGFVKNNTLWFDSSFGDLACWWWILILQLTASVLEENSLHILGETSLQRSAVATVSVSKANFKFTLTQIWYFCRLLWGTSLQRSAAVTVSNAKRMLWSLQRFCWIKSLLGKGKGSSAGTSLLRDKFC